MTARDRIGTREGYMDLLIPDRGSESFSLAIAAGYGEQNLNLKNLKTPVPFSLK